MGSCITIAPVTSFTQAPVITIAIANNKGGVGKTTTAGSLAAGLAKAGHRVLLVDLDAQCNLSSWLGPGKLSPDHVGALLLATPAQAATWRTVPVSPGLELLPCHQLLGESLEKLRKQKDPAPYFRLRDRLAQLAPRFDYAVLDCPPGHLDGMTYNAFCAAQAYVVATDPEPFAVEGLALLMQLALGVQAELNKQLRFIGFVLPKFNPAVRGAVRRSMLDAVTNRYGAQCILGNVRQDAAVPEAQAVKQTLFDYAPESRATSDYATITSKLLTRL